MKVERVEYTDISSVPSEYSDIDVECGSCNTVHQIGELEDDVRCSSCDFALKIQVIEDYVIASHTPEEGSVKLIDMPELPKERYERLIDEYGISQDTSEKVTSTRARADFYETLANRENGDVVGSLLTDEIFGELNYRDMGVVDVDVEDFEYLVELVVEDKITDKQMTDIIRKSLDNDLTTKEVFEKHDYEIASVDEVDTVVKNVVEAETQAVDDYKSGEDGAVNYLVGQVMSEVGGGTDAQKVREKLIDEIEN